jgi:hypothetical protein
LLFEYFRAPITLSASDSNVARCRIGRGFDSFDAHSLRGSPGRYDPSPLLQQNFFRKVDVRDYAEQLARKQKSRSPREHFTVATSDDHERQLFMPL